MNNNEENNGTAYAMGPPKKKGKKQESDSSSDESSAHAKGPSVARAKSKREEELDSEDDSSDDDDDEEWIADISGEMMDPNNPDETFVQQMMTRGGSGGGDDDDDDYDEEEEEVKVDGRGSLKELQRKRDNMIEMMKNGTMPRGVAENCAKGVVSHRNIYKLVNHPKAGKKGFAKLPPTDRDVIKHGKNDTLGLSFEMKANKCQFVCSKILNKEREKKSKSNLSKKEKLKGGGFQSWESTLNAALGRDLGYKMIVPGVNCVGSGKSGSSLGRYWKKHMEGNKIKFIMTKEVHYLKETDLE